MESPTSNSLLGKVSEILFSFTAWLNTYGETSWDHQSFFAGPVGGAAKTLYYRNKVAGIRRRGTDDLVRSLPACRPPAFSPSNSISDRGRALRDGLCFSLRGDE